MPRQRNPENRGLPIRWQLTHGAYYYQVPPGRESDWDGRKKFRLGTTAPEAYRVWADRIGPTDGARNIGQLLDRYALQVVPTKAPRSQLGNRTALPLLRKRFGHMPLTALKPQHVYQYADKRTDADGNPARTAAHREIELLSHAFTKAVEWGLIDRHPFKGEVRLTGTKARTRYVEDWEIAEVLRVAPLRKKGSVRMCQAYVRLKLATGLRQTDMLRLRVADATPAGIAVQPSKTAASTGKRLVFKWTSERRAAWDAAIAARPLDIGPYVFCTDRGKCFVDSNGLASSFQSVWQRFMARVLKETKVKARFAERDLRAKAGSDAPSLERAQSLLGHTDARVTRAHYRRKAEVIE